jgi:hypothetical protein
VRWGLRVVCRDRGEWLLPSQIRWRRLLLGMCGMELRSRRHVPACCCDAVVGVWRQGYATWSSRGAAPAVVLWLATPWSSVQYVLGCILKYCTRCGRSCRTSWDGLLPEHPVGLVPGHTVNISHSFVLLKKSQYLSALPLCNTAAELCVPPLCTSHCLKPDASTAVHASTQLAGHEHDTPGSSAHGIQLCTQMEPRPRPTVAGLLVAPQARSLWHKLAARLPSLARQLTATHTHAPSLHPGATV